LSSTNGGPNDPPLRLGASLCDQGTGMWAVIGALALLRERSITGRGGIVNTSLLETALVWNAQKSDSWVNLGELPPRHASGHPGFVPYEAFDTADGPLLICCGNDRLFGKLAHEIGCSEWIDDARFKRNADRLKNKAALSELLTAVGATIRSRRRALLTHPRCRAGACHRTGEASRHFARGAW
jgi:crotonobetainyl-CoA:carnitine CoA-transferase CaiB-like acyl-CoA transferase